MSKKEEKSKMSIKRLQRSGLSFGIYFVVLIGGVFLHYSGMMWNLLLLTFYVLSFIFFDTVAFANDDNNFKRKRKEKELNASWLTSIITMTVCYFVMYTFTSEPRLSCFKNYTGFWFLAVVIFIALSIPFFYKWKRKVRLIALSVFFALIIAPMSGIEAGFINYCVAKEDRSEIVQLYKKEEWFHSHTPDDYTFTLVDDNGKEHTQYVFEETFKKYNEGDSIEVEIKRGLFGVELWIIE